MNSVDFQIIAQITGYSLVYVRKVLLYKERSCAVIEDAAKKYMVNKKSLSQEAMAQREVMKAKRALSV